MTQMRRWNVDVHEHLWIKSFLFKAIDGLAIHFITNSLSQNVLSLF